MALFSRLPIKEIAVASVLGILSGFYIFAPGIIEFSKQIPDKNLEKSGQGRIQDGGEVNTSP